MKISRRVCWAGLSVVLLLVLGNPRAFGQKSTAASRVVGEVDDQVTVTLKGNVHPLTRLQSDIGAVPDSKPMQRMLLLLQRSGEQEAALGQLLDAQQTKSSANYHAWLTPQQFGTQFGPSDADVQAVTDWLTKQGFQVAKVAAGRTVVEFNGTAGQVRNAFHSEIHRFVANGEEHFANVSDPAIPQALAPVVAGVVALHNYPKRSHAHIVGVFQRDLATGQVKPLFTYTDMNGTFYGVGPADFARIYNIPSTATGAGQSIAIVGQSNVNLQDIQDFRTLFNLPQNFTSSNIILNGPDPGVQGPATPGAGSDEGESDLDIEWAGAVAPQAQLLFVTSQTTGSNLNQVSSGIDLSALYIVDNNLAPVMSESYGACEAGLGVAGNGFYYQLWEQAAAQGITVVISAGDTGSAACDPGAPPADQNASTLGLAVSGLASTPFNVAIGGTDFDQVSNATNYWSATNNATTQLSALGYIPETAWDDSVCAANYLSNGAACTTVDQSGGDLSAGGGGPSGCITVSGSACTGGYPKPAFQQGKLTVADNVRDVPDVAMFASNGNNFSFYIACQSDQNPNNAPCDLSTSATSGTHNFLGVGGTSAPTPAFAAIMALVNQSEVSQGRSGRQGNANYKLYGLANQENYSACNSSSFTNPATPPPATCVFYDVTKGTNSVACDAGKPNCSNTGSSGFGVLISSVAADNGNPAFKAVTNYDLATGLGSVNVANLLNSWNSVSRTPTTTALSNPSGATNVSGQNFDVTVTVTSTTGTPAGDVSLIATTPAGTAGFGPFTLSGGSVTAMTNLLPPGTTQIVAYYGGDATHAASPSAPLTLAVTGAGMTSTVTVSFVTYDSNNNPVLNSSGNVPYGTNYILQVKVKSSTDCAASLNYPNTKQTIPCPTGTITLTDNGSALNDFPNGATPNATNVAKLNNLGFAEDQPIQLAPGNHNIAATYSGDANYSSGNSNTAAVIITKATTTTGVSSSLSSFPAGTSVTLTATIGSTSNSALGPTGTVQFANGSTNLGSPVKCTPAAASGTTRASCTATLTTTISALYPRPQGRPTTPKMPLLPLAIAGLCAALYLMGLRWMPEKRRHVYAYAGLIAFALLAIGIAGCGGGSGGGGGGGSTRTINAAYGGDTNYSSSSGSAMVTIQ